MSNGFGPLLDNLGTIRHNNHEYWLSWRYTSAGGSWIEINDNDGCCFSLPPRAAIKVAAAILYAAADQTDDRDEQDPYIQVLKRIIADELDREPEQQEQEPAL